MVDMVMISRTSASAKAMESLHKASQSMGPVHGSWWRTSSSTRVLGDTPSVRGPRGPEPLQWLQRLQTLESLQDPDFDRGVFRPGGVKEKQKLMMKIMMMRRRRMMESRT